MDYEKASADLKRYLPLKIVTLAWFLFIFALGAYAIAATSNKWWPYPALDIKSLDDARPAVYSFIAGLLGGTTRAFRSFYWAVGPQNPDRRRYQYDPNWTWWYVSRPVMGAFLGGFTYAALWGGVGAFGGVGTPRGGAPAAYFAVAFLAGFSVTEVLSWTTAAAERIFNAVSLRRRRGQVFPQERHDDNYD